MVAIKLTHSNRWKHQNSILKRLQAFWKGKKHCDIVLQSHDGKQHHAHRNILGAASVELDTLLNRVKPGHPMEMAASAAAVHALLQYIYGGEPQIELEDSFELLDLADSYNFPALAAAIEAGLRASLDTAPITMALKVLQLTHNLHKLKDACEEKVAENFEMCIELDDFLELSAAQLGRILRRQDLRVSREEVVVMGLFRWFNRSKDQGGDLALLLHHVDLQSLSSSNLSRLRSAYSALTGPAGQSFDREVAEAMESHRKRSAAKVPQPFQAKRRCLAHYSTGLGASSHAPRKVLPDSRSMCLHDGAIYHATVGYPGHPGSNIFRWKFGDSTSQCVAGSQLAGFGAIGLLGAFCRVSVSPDGKLFIGDVENRRLLSFGSGSGNTLLSNVDIGPMCCSPNGIVYLVTEDRQTLQKLVSGKLQTLVSCTDLPKELHFKAFGLFVTKDEVIYISDRASRRVLRLNPGEAKPVVVGVVPNRSSLNGLFVTEEETIYVADIEQKKVWSFHPRDATWTEVLAGHGDLKPLNVLVQGQSLYVSMGNAGDANGIYEYSLPPELQL